VRIGSFLLFILALAGCHRGAQAGKDAVREGVLDYLSGRKDLSIGSMNVEVTSVQFDGNTADATVAFSPKGVPSSQGMTMRSNSRGAGGWWCRIRIPATPPRLRRVGRTPTAAARFPNPPIPT